MIEHPTSNIQHPVSTDLAFGHPLGVECSVLVVGYSR